MCIPWKHIAQNLTKQRENRARLESSSGSGQKFEKRIEKSNDDLKKNVDAFNNALNIYEPNFVETTKIFTGTNSLCFSNKNFFGENFCIFLNSKKILKLVILISLLYIFEMFKQHTKGMDYFECKMYHSIARVVPLKSVVWSSDKFYDFITLEIIHL